MIYFIFNFHYNGGYPITQKIQSYLYTDKENFILTLKDKHKVNILALDLGSKKVGVAKANLVLKIPLPLTTIYYSNNLVLSKKLKYIIAENQIDGLVVGLPKDDEEIKNRFIAFIEALQLNLPYIFEDEAYTTKSAHYKLMQLGLKRKARQQKVDQTAAVVILESFLAL